MFTGFWEASQLLLFDFHPSHFGKVGCVSDSSRCGYRAKAEDQPAQPWTKPESQDAAPQHVVPAALSKKARAQAKLAAKKVEREERKAEQAASAAAAQQLIEAQAAAEKPTMAAASIAAAAEQEAIKAAQQQLIADATAAAVKEAAEAAEREAAERQVAESAAALEERSQAQLEKAVLARSLQSEQPGTRQQLTPTKQPPPTKQSATFEPPGSNEQPGTIQAQETFEQSCAEVGSSASSHFDHCSQHDCDMPDCPTDTDVCNSHWAHTELSHVDTTQLAGKMVASHSSCHSGMQQVPASPQQTGTCPSHWHQVVDMQLFRLPHAISLRLTSAASLPKSYSQAALDEQPAADDACQLADTQQAFVLSRSASADDSSASVSNSGQLWQVSQASGGASSCPAHAYLDNSQSSADEQTGAPVSAKSDAEKQVLASQQALGASEAAMSSTPAITKVTSPTWTQASKCLFHQGKHKCRQHVVCEHLLSFICVSCKSWRDLKLGPLLLPAQYPDSGGQTQQRTFAMQADTRGASDSTQAAPAACQQHHIAALQLRMIASHGSHDITDASLHAQALADTTLPAATPGSPQGAAAAVEGHVSTVQAPDAQGIWAPWHAGPFPAHMPPFHSLHPRPHHTRCHAACLPFPSSFLRPRLLLPLQLLSLGA